MMISTSKFFVSEALKSLKRNKTISIASAATVAATLFILGIFLILVLNVKQGILQVESKVEVKIYLKDNITMTDQQNLENRLKSVNGVVDVNYESKSDAMQKFKTQLGEQNKGLLDGLDKNNPMPSSYIVRVNDPEVVSNVVQSVNGMSGIDSIKDGRDIVNKLISIIRTIKWVGSIIFIILAGVSLFLIGNTIRLTVYSRRREIGIMKYIGATDWFIRWPFIIEGIIIGIAGGIISDVVLFYLYRLAYAKISSGLIVMNLISPTYVITTVLLLFIVVGAVIGSIGSIISMRKFLAV
ncbi:ABC transporter permease [Clostridium fermenticellae]|uniref:Cell division protein FtsX n=1 Tax=Clostridium fermenticellae TaxID=2068654 RepID=A0A386H1F7_9CLOT|nr:permease-like cell division protein FtsX [Clostridium fermenticellae]AYD39383.1 ABC transporter permease [Clostridium fermenticellae]